MNPVGTKEATWRETIVPPTATIGEAIAALDRAMMQICLVVDAEGRLLGTITDGDIRRGLLRSIPLSDPVGRVFNPHPRILPPDTGTARILEVMTEFMVRQIPLVDRAGRVVGLATLDALLGGQRKHPNWVVLMAGGRGKRLMPLTEEVPKPLLDVGGKPILETIVDNFVRQGFHRFYLSVNYRAEMLKAHFGDGSAFGCEIRYLDENEPLGTAGPLGLIEERPTSPLLVMNGDLLTKVDFDALLNYHLQHGAAATMAVREYDFEVPFGVVRLDGSRILEIEEKPVHRFHVNAGIYVIEPEVLELIEPHAPLDMPDAFRRLMRHGRETAVFPVREYWVDIGRLDDLDRAKRDFEQEFAGR